MYVELVTTLANFEPTLYDFRIPTEYPIIMIDALKKKVRTDEMVTDNNQSVLYPANK